METLGLKNINMLTKEQFDGVENPAADELYAVSSSGFGKPSSKYIDLTLGASGATYTAPADGWFMISSQGWTAMDVHNVSAGQMGNVFAVRSDKFARSTVEAKKGQSIGVWYAGTPTNTVFRFIFDEGEI